MTDKQKIRALAELDGYDVSDMECHLEKGCDCKLEALPRYLGSYDAIIPLIQKQDGETLFKIAQLICLAGSNYWTLGIRVPPSELCDALLKATGKWVE